MPPRLPAAPPAGGPRARTPRARWRPAPAGAPRPRSRPHVTAAEATQLHAHYGIRRRLQRRHRHPLHCHLAPARPGDSAPGVRAWSSRRAGGPAGSHVLGFAAALVRLITSRASHLALNTQASISPSAVGQAMAAPEVRQCLSGPFADHDSRQHRTGGAVPWQAARARAGGGECSRPQPLESLISVSYSQQSLVRVHDFFGSEWLEGLAGARVPQGCVVSWQAGRAVEEPQLVGPTLPKAWGSWDLKPALAFRPGDPSVRQYW